MKIHRLKMKNYPHTLCGVEKGMGQGKFITATVDPDIPVNCGSCLRMMRGEFVSPIARITKSSEDGSTMVFRHWTEWDYDTKKSIPKQEIVR